MKMFARIVAVVGVLFIVYVSIGLLLPKRYHVERSIVIDRAPDAIFPTINTLKEWPAWTAWTVERYPDMKVTFDGPESGVGAKYAWTGEKAGNGNLKITESDPAQGIKYELDFDNGKYRSIGGIRLEPTGNSTKAIWWNEGNLGWRPINRYFGLLMDSMMGPDFQTGLNNLKKKVESAQAAPASTETAPADSKSDESKTKTG
jgi:hypothetical protein